MGEVGQWVGSETHEDLTDVKSEKYFLFKIFIANIPIQSESELPKRI